MFHRFSDHISNCYARAADAHRRADETADPERRADLLLMERSWRDLAQSYQLSEQLGRALLKRSRELEDRTEWRRVAVAPFDCDLELATIGAGGIRPIEIACRRILNGWVAADTRKRLDIHPTHWRAWTVDIAMKAVRAPVRPRRSASGPAAKAFLLPLQSNE